MLKEPAQPQKSQRTHHMHPMDCQVQTGARRQSRADGSAMHTTQIVMKTSAVSHLSSKQLNSMMRSLVAPHQPESPVFIIQTVQ